MRRLWIATVVALTSSLAFGEVVATEDEAKWDLEKAHAETTKLDFETSEGTWMSVDVAPDGTTIAFDLLGHLYEMPADGGEARALTSGRSWNMFPRYSPDGKKVAFTSDRDGDDDLWVLERETGELENVSDTPGTVFRPTWSADGRHLFGTTQEEDAGTRGLAFNLHGSHQELAKGATFRPMVELVDDPQRDKIYFEQIDAQLYASGARIKAYDKKTGKVTVYVERPGGAMSPALSADGSRLAYVHRADLDTVLVVHDLDTRRERIVYRGLDRDRQESPAQHYGAYTGMAWHPGGDTIVIAAGGRIRSVDVETGEAREIPFRARVKRQIDRAIRFRAVIPETEAATRLHRWGQRTGLGIVFEALGDLYLKDGDALVNLTNSPAHETHPIYDARTSMLYYAAWTDDELGAVYSLEIGGDRATPVKLTSRPSQYGSLAVASDGSLAYLRGRGGLLNGQRMDVQDRFDLLVRDRDGNEHKVTEVAWTQNFAAKHPPAVVFGPAGEHLYFNEFDKTGEGPQMRETLALKRIRRDGHDEVTLYHFPHAVHAVPSPDLRWIAFREYQRGYLTPFELFGKTVSVNAHDKKGTARRIDPDDGNYLSWSADSSTLAWTRGSGFYEKSLDDILKKEDDEDRTEDEEDEDDGNDGNDGDDGNDGSKARRTELSFRFDVAAPRSTIALRGVRVVTMNGERAVLEDATVVLEGPRVKVLGTDVEIPPGAKVFDLAGHTVVPGFVDCHAHPETNASPLNVVAQRPAGLQAALAYGVTTAYEVYGNPSHKDFWVSDMERAGAVTAPRLFSVGAPIFGQREFRPKLYRPISTLDDAREVVRYNRDHGATGLKDYAYFQRKARHLLTIAARELGLNVYSETAGIPQMNFTQVVDGVTGLEHTPGLTPLYEDAVRLLAASSTGITPTLLVVYNGTTGESRFHQTERVWEDGKLLRFTRAEDLLHLRRPTHYWPDDLYAPEMARAMKKLLDAGVSIQLGAHGQMPGVDAHWELELFVEGGFTPHEALEAATLAGARYHGLDLQVGSIEPGKLADLVVLSDNPLEDIRHTRSIVYVVKHGVVYDGDDVSRVWPDPRPAGRMYFHRGE